MALREWHQDRGEFFVEIQKQKTLRVVKHPQGLSVVFSSGGGRGDGIPLKSTVSPYRYRPNVEVTEVTKRPIRQAEIGRASLPGLALNAIYVPTFIVQRAESCGCRLHYPEKLTFHLLEGPPVACARMRE